MVYIFCVRSRHSSIYFLCQVSVSSFQAIRSNLSVHLFCHTIFFALGSFIIGFYSKTYCIYCCYAFSYMSPQTQLLSGLSYAVCNFRLKVLCASLSSLVVYLYILQLACRVSWIQARISELGTSY